VCTRYYDPSTGRFTQQDSVEVIGDPGRGNRYTYAGDNPGNRVDPAGESWWDILDIASTVVDMAIGCVSGLAATDESGVGETTGVLGGPVGFVAANVAGCAVGDGLAYVGASEVLG